MKNIIYTKNSPQNVMSFMTTKDGGYSLGKISGFNLGINTQDDFKNVLKNYKLLETSTDIKNLVILNQVHGNIVREVSSENIADVYLSEADGLFTKEANIALGVLTADCYPVHLFGKNAVAVLHCGWRSLNSGIIENALKLFDKIDIKPNEISAHIGAGICKNCYEVKDDMVCQLNKNYNVESALEKIAEGFYKLDLRKLLLNALEINGIKKYSYETLSSCCSDIFYSYRRDNAATGRMISVVMRRD